MKFEDLKLGEVIYCPRNERSDNYFFVIYYLDAFNVDLVWITYAKNSKTVIGIYPTYINKDDWNAKNRIFLTSKNLTSESSDLFFSILNKNSSSKQKIIEIIFSDKSL